MIELKYIGRTRAFTFPEVLRVVARVLTRPGHPLVQPSSIRPLDPKVAAAPAAELVLDSREVAGIAGWAQVMVPGPARITITRTVGPAVMVQVVGMLAEAGPTVIVIAWVDDWPVEVDTFTTRRITASDLYSVALNALLDGEPSAPRRDLVVVR